jgi:Holliday junction resolvasome RuvABC endonuclease subunit
MSIICGFDPPSVKNLGYALFSINKSKKTIKLKSAGIIQLKDEYKDEQYNYDFAVKTSKLENFLDNFYEENKIKEIVMEKQVLSTKTTKYATPNFIAVQTGLMSNTIEKLSYENNLKRYRIHNRTLKKQVTGDGNCSKQDVLDKMVELLGLELDYEAEDCTEKQYLKKYEHCFDSMALCLAQYSDCKVLSYGEFRPLNFVVEGDDV